MRKKGNYDLCSHGVEGVPASLARPRLDLVPAPAPVFRRRSLDTLGRAIACDLGQYDGPMAPRREIGLALSR